ncbi:hypothetical protein AB0391_05515 [Streptomyces albidoflavus]|uniref:hypothetical protein n=1 Tax=Streptomyces TaxID=1883 RepID=UPI00224EF126|nr:hypothetical protein [Streptomyces sp. FT1]MCX5461634.1 hypothetical protein [Streptomyces sp. FT1]
MDVFVCAGCEAVLSASVARVALPVHARQRWGHSLMPVLMGSGTYAVDQEPGGPAGAAVLAPGDLRGTVLLPERCDGCCGSAGGDGPNLACVRCGLPVPEDPRALALVPVHPRTGEVWPCPGGVDGVPLDAAVWLHVARGPDELPHPAAGRVPAGVHRDEPLPLRPLTLFRADLDVFLRTLSRLPAFREPWLRRIHEEVRGRGYAGAPF